MKISIKTTVACMMLTTVVPVVEAQVSYSLTDVSGSTWQYSYSVTNNFAVGAVGEFTIYSPVGDYANISVISSPGSWSSIAVQPDPNIPAAGYFDSLALAEPLAAGKSLSGFTERFTWLGKGTPGSQTFDIVNTNTFATLFQGSTVSAAVRAPEIDPSSGIVALTILAGGLLILRGSDARRPA